MFTFLLAVHIIVAIVMIGFILIQHGKGADAGTSFGSGASGTVFGASGSGNFLSRTTAILAVIFFITSLTLAWFARREAESQFRLDVPAQTAPATTSAPATAPQNPPASQPTSE